MQREPEQHDQPPAGAWFREDASGFELGSTTRSAVAFFLVPFMCIWSGFSLGLIYGTQMWSGKFNVSMSLFGIPFVVFSVFFWFLALMTACGKVVVSVKDDEGRIFSGVWRIGRTRKFKWRAIREIREGTEISPGNNRYKDIVLRGDTRISFGAGLKKQRRSFMLNALQTQLRKRDGGVVASS